MAAAGSASERQIRLVLADDHWVVREGLHMYLARDPDFQIVGEAEDGSQAVRLAPETLTEPETEVLRLISLGLANKEIARRLRIGDGTVKTHVSSLLGKLGLQSRTQAALHAVRIGLVGPDEIGTT
jgi:DNA-binding NarL/FixJ family response regulator